MARNKPVTIWATRHTPRSEPKFHQDEILAGEGRSINEPLIILRRGWDFRIVGAISFCS